MIELRSEIQALLKTIHPRVFFQEATEKVQFPYVVFDLPNSILDGEGFQNITLDIDGWDKPSGGDSTEIETLMEVINAAIDKKTLTTDNLVVSIYLENKLPLQDDDKRIKRRKYVYQARLFERS